MHPDNPPSYDAWIGRTETSADQIGPTPIRLLRGTLDDEHASALPAHLPPLWHWLYFLPGERQSSIGPDGHPRRGGFLPPIALPRRMWAGGRLRFLRPLAVGAATDTSAVNRLYAAGLAAVTDAFSVRCYPLLADCSSSNGTVFKTDKEPNSLYFNVPANSAFTVKCGLVTNARPMHNYSSIRGWVAPVRLPAVSAKFTARFGQMTTVVRMGRDRDAFTLVPDQAAGGYKIGEIIDITFDHVRDADAGGDHIRVREIYYSNAEQKWKMKTTQALAPETSSNSGYPVCVYAVVYEQYQDGGYDTEDRGALWLLHGGNSSRSCVKIATVKGVHCFESIYPFSGYYLDMENTNSWALAGAFLPATMHLHCNNVNPAYYGFSSMESNIIVSEAVEDFVDPEAETITED